MNTVRPVLAGTGVLRVAGRFAPGLRGKVRADARQTETDRAEKLLRTRFAVQLAGRTVLRDRDQPIIAEPSAVITPLLARRATLDLVCAVLTAESIPFFTLRTRKATESAVAVSAADRARALAALATACTAEAAYVAPEPPVKGVAPELGEEFWQGFADASAVRVVRYFSAVTGSLLLGREYGCVVEFWQVQDGRLVAPRSNRVAESVPVDGELVAASEHTFTRLAPLDGQDPAAPRYPTRAEFVGTLVDDFPFPVDVVYTWVDDSDPAWRGQREQALAADTGAAANGLSANASRYINRDELRYSLRSIALFAPWVRHIWIVTAGQSPSWLDPADPKVTVVDHKAIFADPSVLPTFNSHAIESQLHHIEGLSEHFLYFNDDVFLGRPVTPLEFFHANGLTKFFLSIKSQVAMGERSPADPPITSSGKNNRRLIQEAFGRVLTQKLQHVPHPLRRSLLFELEERYAAEFTATAGHRFRHEDDISVPSSLYHYYAFLTGSATPGTLVYSYTDLAHEDTPAVLRGILGARDQDVFCVNDTSSDEADHGRQAQLTDWFLREYFSVPSPSESPATGASERSASGPREG